MLNNQYLGSMPARESVTLGRVWDLWWPAFIEYVNKYGPSSTLDQLDIFMAASRDRLIKIASEHAAKSAEPGTDRYRQLASQVIKSNTGKMFERFVGLALAYCLKEDDAAYCIQPFTDAALRNCHGLERSRFVVNFKFGDGTLSTPD